MMKTITDNPVLASAIMLVCAIFTYGGAVNLGFSGFTMAVPFMGLWGLIAYHSKKPLLIISAIVFLIICGFYGFKKTDNGIFYPANDMTATLNKNACFNVYADFILISEFKDSDDCLNTYKSMPDVRKSKIMSAGTPFRITGTEISHADMGEQVQLRAHDVDGTLYITDLTYFNKSEGVVLQTSDLQQPYFYYPSLLMLWPVFPILILTAFSR